ncbi:MAG: oligoendopeptidase F [Clostridia bacterium]|nr:oligoendopeptidase F [Oscillospiraceae bacterium]MBQ7830400.1 oligoendopeptidase F [Clostridia bacterium]MBQ7830437.1 oligoendopeptidase F [Clostridia bacterium]
MAKERSQVPANLKWRVEDIYESVDEWNKVYASLEDKLDFSKYEGKLGDPELLLECLQGMNAVSLHLVQLAVYAHMRHDEDTRSSEFTALQSRLDMLWMRLMGSVAFVEPELTELPVEYLEGLIADERFKDYDYTLRQTIKRKPHVLSKEIEALLSQESRVFDCPSQVFGMIDNADFPYPTIKVGGEKVTVTHGMYGVMLHSPDRKARRDAFRAYYKAYIGLINTITAAYVGNVDKDVFLARARKYNSSLERALDNEDVDVKVYQNLLKSVNKALPLLHRYYRDKKKILGYKSMHMYDVYVSPVEDAEIKVDYEDAFKIVKEGLAPLGEEYAKLLQEAHDNGWIDVEETAGKRSGAYSTSAYGTKHPYVLLNYQKTTSDVFTLAHELGHAMHSYYSDKNQPQEKAGYTLFVAEVASTVNEVLLLKYLMKTTTDQKLKKYLLSYYMDMLKGTLFRQTQFAEFEYIAHDMAEKGQPLTKDSLNEVYYNLNKKYYGRSVVSDPEIAYEWARIPHFYRGFYVYKYATGIITAVSIAERIYNEGEAAVADYFKFLSSGGSDSPVELLKLAGVDLTKMDAFNSCMASFKAALEEFEALD